MAAIFTLAGGLLGFVSALLSLAFFDAGFLLALAIWSGVGIGGLVLGLALMLRREDASQRRHMAADPHPV